MSVITPNDVAIGKIEVLMASMSKSIDEIKVELKEQRTLYATKVEVAEINKELEEIKQTRLKFVNKEDLRWLWTAVSAIWITILLAIVNAFLKLINL